MLNCQRARTVSGTTYVGWRSSARAHGVIDPSHTHALNNATNVIRNPALAGAATRARTDRATRTDTIVFMAIPPKNSATPCCRDALRSHEVLSRAVLGRTGLNDPQIRVAATALASTMALMVPWRQPLLWRRWPCAGPVDVDEPLGALPSSRGAQAAACPVTAD
jgi:hypothetical protein